MCLLAVKGSDENDNSFYIYANNCIICTRDPLHLKSWTDNYEMQLDNVDSKKYEYYILGDININFQPAKTRNKYNNMKWSNLVSKFGLKQYVSSPTRVTKKTSTLIDHIYSSVNYCGSISNAFISTLFISDHYPICCTRKISRRIKLYSATYFSSKTNGICRKHIKLVLTN